MIIALFIVLVFFYSLVSRRLERTVITAPILFATAGLLVCLLPPQLSALELERTVLLHIAELGLVMLLFTDAAHIDLRVLKGNRNLPIPPSERRHVADHPARRGFRLGGY